MQLSSSSWHILCLMNSVEPSSAVYTSHSCLSEHVNDSNEHLTIFSGSLSNIK